jgi:recombination protein RecA
MRRAKVPRGKPGTSKKGAKKATPQTGVLALARKAGAKALKKDEGDWLVQLDEEMLKESLPHVPTGSIIFDYLIGGEVNQFGVMPCPGLPRGRVSQMWGHESSGKSTFALTAAATCISNGGTVLYVDWEYAIVPDYAHALGVPITDASKFNLVQPDTLEDGIKLAMIYALAGVDLIIFDSVGAAVPARIANRSLEDVGEQARVGELQAVWSQEITNLRGAAAKKGAAIFGISQIRAKISKGPSHGPTTQPQGGNAWKFASDVRLELRRFRQEKTKLYDVITHKTDERVSGAAVKAKVIKCKLSKSQGREALFYLRHGHGIDDLRSVMEIAVAHGIIKKGGAWLSWESPNGVIKKQGITRFREAIEEDEGLRELLYNQVLPFLGSSTFSDDDLEEIDDEDLSDVDALLAEANAIEDSNKAPSEEEGEESEDGEEESE